MSKSQKTYPLLLILVCVFLLGGSLRIIGMAWGLPYQLHPDEPVLFINAWERWDTGSARLMGEYPPLYLQVLVAQREFIYRVFGADTPQEVYFFFGRWNSIMLSLLIMAAAYLVGKYIAGWQTGLVFMAFMAMEPISAVQLGWLIKVDNLAWLLALLTLFATFMAARRHSWRWLGGAFLLCALTTIAKYNLVFVGFAPLYVLLNWRINHPWMTLLLIMGVLIGGMWLGRVIIRHYWQSHIGPAFNHCSGFPVQAGIPEPIEFLPCGPFDVFQKYIYPLYQREQFWDATNMQALRYMNFLIEGDLARWRIIIAAVLLVVGLWRSKPVREASGVLFSVMLPTIFLFGMFGVEFPIRQFYILILCGGLLLALGMGEVWRWNRWVYAALFGVVILSFLPDDVSARLEFRKPDTRAVTADYFLNHARRGEAVVVEYDHVEFTRQYGGFPQSDGYFNIIPASKGIFGMDVPGFFEDGIYYVVTDFRIRGEDSYFQHQDDLPENFDLVLDLTGDEYYGPKRRIYRTFRPQYPVQVRFGDGVMLYGYDLSVEDQTLNLKLYWHSQAANLPDYTLFVHVVDPVSGESVTSQDRPPERMTSQWDQYEWVFDERVIPIPLGTYAVQIGLYDSATLDRLPVNDDPIGILDLTMIAVE